MRKLVCCCPTHAGANNCPECPTHGTEATGVVSPLPKREQVLERHANDDSFDRVNYRRIYDNAGEKQGVA